MSKKIANIVSDRPLKYFGPLYSQTTNINAIDKTLPTLVVGIKKATECINGLSLIQTRYDGDVWWTFSRTERRSDFESVVSEFKKHALRKVLDGVRYEYVDFICYPQKRVKSFIRYMKNNDKKIVFLTRGSRFAFIYSPKYSVVWGLSLSLCDYIGVDRHKVVRKIKSNRHNEIISDTSFINSEVRSILGNDTHLITAVYDLINF